MNNETVHLENKVDGTFPAPARRRTKWAVVGGTALLAGLVLAAGIVPRLRAHDQLVSQVQENAKPMVLTTNVTRVSPAESITLPASVRALEEASLYARANGYLKKWHADIGAKVAAGDVLAELDTPELDQELNQARATRQQAKANLDLARSTAERWVNLLKEKAVSQQEVDEKQGALAAREADLNAAQASVSRLEQLTNYKRVVAPFSGIVTSRNVDTGDLILSGSAGAVRPLFTLAKVNTLRVYVDVPQARMRDIAVGQEVQVKVSEFPGRVFSGKVARTAGALDPATRTLLTEVQVNNEDGSLMPGIHADVSLQLVRSEPPLVVPATSIIIRGAGPTVAVVDNAQTIHIQKIQLGRDMGTSIEVVAGLADNSTIVLNPSDTLTDGTQVSQPRTAKSDATSLARN